MNPSERHRLCAEILQATNGGKHLAEDDLLMVHHELLNDAEKDDDTLLQLFHEEVTTGQYPDQSLFGLKGLTCDEDCHIFYEGNLVAMTNRRWLNYTKESLPWAKELHKWCLEQDQKGAEISYVAALLRDVPPERLVVPKAHPTQPNRKSQAKDGMGHPER